MDQFVPWPKLRTTVAIKFNCNQLNLIELNQLNKLTSLFLVILEWDQQQSIAWVVLISNQKIFLNSILIKLSHF